MQNKWMIREYEEGDEQGILALFDLVFNKKRDVHHWNWEFKEIPRGSKIFMAVDNGNVVGHLGALLRRVRIGEEAINGALEVDGMTHPDYTRQGIFVSLGKEMLTKLSKENDVDLVYGFSNVNAMPGHRKLNCMEVLKLPVMVKIINPRRVVSKRFKNRLLAAIVLPFAKFGIFLFQKERKPIKAKDFTIMRIYHFDEDFNEFFEVVSKEHEIIMERDVDYLNWRYTKTPREDYTIMVAEKDKKILGLAVVRIVDMFDLKSGAILELFSLPEHEYVLNWLIIKIFDHFKSYDLDLIACSIPRNAKAYDALTDCGFIPCPKRFKPKETRLIVYPTSDEIDIKSASNPDNWYITWGDTDVV